MTRVIGFVVYPGFQLLDVAGPVAAFEAPTHVNPTEPYQVKLMSKDGAPVRSSFGVVVETVPFGRDELDTLLVVGGWGIEEPIACPETIDFIKAAQPRRLGSVCSGAYVLAQAGLLDGRRAATHWRRVADFRARFPQVKLDEDAIFVREGAIWTSAGITAGIDLALALIADDLGDEVAREVARELVVYHRRPGGQSQHSALLRMPSQSDRIARAIQFARDNLSSSLTVERLAAEAGVSPRQFSRMFTRESGQTPAKAVEQMRLDVAKIEIASRRYSIEEVARMTGFSDAERMREAFVRTFGQTPQAYRRDRAAT